MYTRNGDDVGLTNGREEEEGAESAALGGGGYRCGDGVDQDGSVIKSVVRQRSSEPNIFQKAL